MISRDEPGFGQPDHADRWAEERQYRGLGRMTVDYDDNHLDRLTCVLEGRA